MWLVDGEVNGRRIFSIRLDFTLFFRRMALQHWHYSSILSPFTTILEYLTYRCPVTMENPCLSLLTYTKPAKGLLCFVSLSISFSLFAPKVPSWITNPGLPSPEPSECRFVPPRRFPTNQAKLIQSFRSDAEWMVTPEKKKKNLSTKTLVGLKVKSKFHGD